MSNALLQRTSLFADLSFLVNMEQAAGLHSLHKNPSLHIMKERGFSFCIKNIVGYFVHVLFVVAVEKNVTSCTVILFLLKNYSISDD